MSTKAATAKVGARWLGLGRMALGATALVAPALPGRAWIGADAGKSQVKVLARALGARDVALGLGVVLALRHDAPARGWVEAGGFADLGDVVATLAAFGSLSSRGRWAVLAAAGGGVVAARLLAPALD